MLLAPAINAAVASVDTRYRRHLRDALTYERRTIEEVTAVISAHTDEAWIRDFGRRYLTPSAQVSGPPFPSRGVT